MRTVGIAATAHYLPERWMAAREIGLASGIPEAVVAEKFGVRGKHVAAPDEHVSDMAVSAGQRALDAAGLEPREVDAVVYYGSTWKDHAVWQVAPRVADRLGCTEAFALELDYVSCGTPVALRVARDMLLAEDELRRVLLVAACRESYLVDYDDPGSRFTYNFGDGAAAAVLERGLGRNEVLGSHMITDGSFSRHVKVPAGGSVEPASEQTVRERRHLLSVEDPADMKARLDPVSLPNFVRAAEVACKRSGISLADVSHLCGIHMKRSMHDELVDALGIPADRASYLDDTGHMSGVDPMLALDRAVAAGDVRDGDHVLALAAGTGYTWAATVVRWGEENA
ncbi:3-oxoacyl-[acyl-carrier-protein] synthase 3 [Nocardioides flavus (ex Wang et al. 2016)]|uniref:3-oxoacyl-[acyl-carrier-protein] synthase 3 n=1 Tax=Nocardioides flavus (ex Wang et al. 2016) TaxID=2058780 RepID=A0ABQ3HM19_9ACTN|nr:3-oxoacyl-ACP synthase [Nocardioides flavus (ex Wang et al. 2016)]GHE17709.1 3-oxoacyl-[acyl-carrier-protein] synthase 3 [Nocardioides flavus (ex Wang et al. 2016)]